jgi:hypothetical protein
MLNLFVAFSRITFHVLYDQTTGIRLLPARSKQIAQIRWKAENFSVAPSFQGSGFFMGARTVHYGCSGAFYRVLCGHPPPFSSRQNPP